MNYSQLNLRTLYEFEAIYRLGNISLAGEEVGRSQPALSHALNRMRESLDDKLFVRTSQGLRPTPRADELAATARRIMAFVRAEMSANAPFDCSKLKRVFNFGMSDIAQMVFLPKIMARLRMQAPLCDVTVMSLAAREMGEALETGAVDVAVGRYPDMRVASLQKEELFTRGFLCVVCSKHPRLKKAKISKAEFQREPHVAVSTSSGNEDAFERLLKNHGLKRRILLKVPHALCVPEIVSKSDLIATVAHSAAISFAHLAGVRVAEPPVNAASTSVAQYWSARYEQEPGHIWIRSVISELFRDHA